MTEKNIDKNALNCNANDVGDTSGHSLRVEGRGGEQASNKLKPNSGLSHHKTECKTIVHNTADDKLNSTKPAKPAGGLNFNFVSVSPR